MWWMPDCANKYGNRKVTHTHTDVCTHIKINKISRKSSIFFKLFQKVKIVHILDSLHINLETWKLTNTSPNWQQWWPNSTREYGTSQLASCIKLKVFQTCVLSTLFYSNKIWTYVRQENCLESFYLCCLQHILNTT